MKVRVYDDDMAVVAYSSEPSSYHVPVEIPDEIIASYDTALASFREAEKKLEEFALPIYEERRRIEREKTAHHKHFVFKEYEVPANLSKLIEKALFNG